MARKTRKNGDIAVQVLRVFAEHREETLTTQEISEKTGIHKSSVSRCLKRLSEMMQIEKVKAGHYRSVAQVSAVEVSSNRTVEDNQKTIDRLLSIYDHLQDAFMPSVLTAFQQERHSEGIQLMKGLTLSMDRLMHRWAIISCGYDANPEQARQDAIFRKQQALSPPEEEEDNRVRAWDPVNKKFLD